MSQSVSQFTKFILKAIFRGIALRDSSETSEATDIYSFNKVELTDDLLEKIFAEGKKYGFDRDRCLNELKAADEKIVTEPSRKQLYGQIDLRKYACGSHLDLHFIHDMIGPVDIMALVDDNHNLMVMSSNINGLKYRTILRPVKLNFAFDSRTYFELLHADDYTVKTISREVNSLFVPGILKAAYSYTPSLIFDLIDTDDSFGYKGKEGKKTESKTASGADEKIGDNVYYTSFTTKTGPLTWLKSELLQRNPLLPFIIRINSNWQATIEVNPKFRFDPVRSVRKYELNAMKLHCKVTGNLNEKGAILTLKEGVLRSKDKGLTWEMSDQIPEIAGEAPIDDKVFKIISKAIFKNIKIKVNHHRLDDLLIDIGIGLSDRVAIMIDIENEIKKPLNAFDRTDISTLRDLYNIVYLAYRVNGKEK